MCRIILGHRNNQAKDVKMTQSRNRATTVLYKKTTTRIAVSHFYFYIHYILIYNLIYFLNTFML